MEVLFTICIVFLIISVVLLITLAVNMIMKHIRARYYCTAYNDNINSYLRAGKSISENNRYWLRVYFPGRVIKEPFPETDKVV